VGLIAGLVLGLLVRPPQLARRAGLLLVILGLAGGVGLLATFVADPQVDAPDVAVAGFLAGMGLLVAGAAGVGLRCGSGLARLGLNVALGLLGLALLAACTYRDTAPMAIMALAPLLLVGLTLAALKGVPVAVPPAPPAEEGWLP
jgi:hypothetical protein